MWLEGNATSKLAGAWKQPKKQIGWKTEPRSLEIQLTIFKSTLIQEDNLKSFPRYSTKFNIECLPALKCLLYLPSSLNPPFSCHFAGKFISRYLYSGEWGPFSPLTSLFK